MTERSNNKRTGFAQLPGPAAKKQAAQQDVQSIDLCDDDDSDSPPAAAAAAAAATAPALNQQGVGREEQHELHQQQQAKQQQQEQSEGAMDVDDGPFVVSPAAAAQPTGHAAAGTPAPRAAAPAADREPATPAGALVSAGAAGEAAAAPSALKSTGGKAAAEVLLTPEQRKQLLEECHKVGWAGAAVWGSLAVPTNSILDSTCGAALTSVWRRQGVSAERRVGPLHIKVYAAILCACLFGRDTLACRNCRCWRRSLMCGQTCRGTCRRVTRSHWTSNTR